MDANRTTELSFKDFDFSLILYCLAALLIGMGGSYYILKTERMITAGGFFLACLAIFIYFGLRWFDGFKLRPSISGAVDTSKPWPPQINFCPDFLSLIYDNSRFYCVDATGSTGGLLEKYTTSSTPNVSKNAFLLTKTNAADGTDKTPRQYATELSTKKLTWEGVYDGRTATNAKIPFPTSP